MKTKRQSPRGNFNSRTIGSIAFALSCLLAPIASWAGPVSELYLTAGQQNTILVVQGGNVNRSWGVVHNNEYAIAVMGTVQTTIGASGLIAIHKKRNWLAQGTS